MSTPWVRTLCNLPRLLLIIAFAYLTNSIGLCSLRWGPISNFREFVLDCGLSITFCQIDDAEIINYKRAKINLIKPFQGVLGFWGFGVLKYHRRP